MFQSESKKTMEKKCKSINKTKLRKGIQMSHKNYVLSKRLELENYRIFFVSALSLVTEKTDVSEEKRSPFYEPLCQLKKGSKRGRGFKTRQD